jgi:hypothetical protein
MLKCFCESGHSFKDLASRVQTKYQVDEKYDYHLKTAMVYFDDAEKELDAIRLVDETCALSWASTGQRPLFFVIQTRFGTPSNRQTHRA